MTGLQIGARELHAAVRNISQAGAMIEMPYEFPNDIQVEVVLLIIVEISATIRWCLDSRAGVEFSEPLSLDDNGLITLLASAPSRLASTSLKTAVIG